MTQTLCHFLIGIPGSGKSTFARQLIEQDAKTVHISSDLIRDQLYGDPIVQGDWSAIERQIQTEFQDAVSRGCSVVYDATNIEKRWRTDFLRDHTPPKVSWIAWVFQTPVMDCIQRNQERPQAVPMDVIIDGAQLLHQFPPQPSEGFIAILDVPMKESGWVDMDQVQVLMTQYRSR
ncbi:MAG: ATP-binding protein [Thermosynechococcaceae cyanobacterium]